MPRAFPSCWCAMQPAARSSRSPAVVWRGSGAARRTSSCSSATAFVRSPAQPACSAKPNRATALTLRAVLPESAAASSSNAVLVTGTSTGIGHACVARLIAEGCSVFAGVRRPEDGARLAAEFPERLRWPQLDVTDPAAIAAAVELVTDTVGEHGLVGLVNNAGVAIGGPLEFIPPALLRRQFEVNVIGLHAVTTAFLPLIRRGHGRIVHIGSIS